MQQDDDFMVSSESSEFEKAATGFEPLAIVGIIDMGHAMETFKADGGGEESKNIRKIRVLFETLVQRTTDKDGNPRPFMLGRDFNFSFAERAGLRLFIEAYLGKKFEGKSVNFDIRQMLGWQGLGNLIQKGDYINVDSFGRNPAQHMMPVMTQPFLWNVKGYYDEAKMKTFGKYVQDRIKRSDEWRAKELAAMPPATSPVYQQQAIQNLPPPPPAVQQGGQWIQPMWDPQGRRWFHPGVPAQPAYTPPQNPAVGAGGMQPNYAAAAAPPMTAQPVFDNKGNMTVPQNPPAGMRYDLNGNLVPEGEAPF